MGIVFGLGMGFVALGLVMMGAAAFVVLRARRDAVSRVPAWGVVVAMRAVPAVRGSIQCPVVCFHAASGEMVTFDSTVGGWPARHAVGQQVTVFYAPDRPREAEIEAPAVLWLVPAGIFGVGLFFAAVGAVLTVAAVAAA